MSEINGGRIFAKALKKEGVECVFTLAGGHIMPILYGCRAEGIQVVDVRHECSGGYGADAYARVSGKPGVLITTAGPGVTNATTAMAEAMDAGIPLIHIGGASPQKENITGPLQELKSLEAMSVFCKWSERIISSDRIPEYVAHAFRNALDNTPGPVYLEIAFEVLYEVYEEDDLYWPEAYRTDSQPFGDPALIEKAAELLIDSKRPVMIVGDNARFSKDYEEYVEQLSNYLSIPVYAMNVARGVFGNEIKNPLWTLGGFAVPAADVILEICVNNNYLIYKGQPPYFPEDAIKIQIHPDKTKIGFNTRADVGIVAGAGAAAKQILENVKEKTEPIDRSQWLETATQLTIETAASYTQATQSDIQPPHPGRAASEVVSFVEKEAPDMHIVADGGDSAQWMVNNAKATYPGQVINYGPLGTIGVGMGFSMGAYMADKKPVLCYTGDGSFGFYPMEFDTFLRHDIPVICVISNDSSWGMIKLSEEICNAEEVNKNGHLACTLEHMRAYEKFVDIWGGVGIQVTRYEDIIPALRKVYESGKPGIVNIQVDETKMSPATAEF